jgi:hypothetical protein
MLFGNRPDQRLLKGTEQLVVESGWLAQAVESDGIYLKGFQVDYRNNETNRQLFEQVQGFLLDLPSSNSTWINLVDRWFADAEADKENRELLLCVGVIASAFLKLDIAAKAALQYPKSRRMNQLVHTGLTTLLVSLSIIFPGRPSEGLFSPISTQRFGVVYPSAKANDLIRLLPRLEIVLNNLI